MSTKIEQLEWRRSKVVEMRARGTNEIEESQLTASISIQGSRIPKGHHAKSFNDICKENNITTIKQVLACKEIWSLDNGISLCHGCHKEYRKDKN